MLVSFKTNKLVSSNKITITLVPVFSALLKDHRWSFRLFHVFPELPGGGAAESRNLVARNESWRPGATVSEPKESHQYATVWINMQPTSSDVRKH